MRKVVNFTTLIVVFLSFSLLPSLVYGQSPDEPEKNVKGEIPQERKNFLDLTPEQKDKLKELRDAHREQNKALFEEMRKLQLEMRELMRDSEVNEKEIMALYDKIAKLRAEKFSRSLEQRKAVRNILTPEQLEKLEKFRSQIGLRRGLQRGGFLGRRGAMMRGFYLGQGRGFLWRRFRHFRRHPFGHRWW